MKVDELRRIAVLREVDGEALTQLAAALEERDYTEGQTVFAEGDPGDSMYFIVNGHIRIEKRAHAAGAQSKTLTVLEAGDYFGEMALLDQKPRSASAIATGQCRVLRLGKPAFEEMQQKSRAASLSVLFAMIRTSSERIRRLSRNLMVYDEVGKAIGEAADLNGLLEVILQQLLGACAADWGLLLLRSQFSERLELRSEFNLTLSPAQRESVSNRGGFLAAALKEPRPELISCFGQDERFRSCERLGFETALMLLAPITVENQFLGLIILGGQEPGQLTQDMLNLACGIARQAGQAILNARHREEEQARSRHSRQYVKF